MTNTVRFLRLSHYFAHWSSYARTYYQKGSGWVFNVASELKNFNSRIYEYICWIGMPNQKRRFKFSSNAFVSDWDAWGFPGVSASSLVPFSCHVRRWRTQSIALFLRITYRETIKFNIIKLYNICFYNWNRLFKP